MRYPTAQIGDTRAVTRFLWLPMGIGTETRWLERATWMERFRRPYGHTTPIWQPAEWLDGTENAPRCPESHDLDLIHTNTPPSTGSAVQGNTGRRDT
jgi:hypothetical protein